MLQRTIKFTIRAFLIVLSIFVLVVLLLQVPSVQNRVVDRVTKALSRQLGTEVRIDRVNIDFLNSIILEGVYLEDQEQTSLLYADQVQADFNLFSLLRHKIEVNQLILKDAKIDLTREPTDTDFNYQFIIDTFAADQPKADAKGPSPWAFQLDRINIRSTAFRMVDGLGPSDIDVRIGNFDARIEAFDPNTKKIAIKSIILDRSYLNYSVYENLNAQIATEVPQTNQGPIPFPDLGWEIVVASLSMEENQVILDKPNEIRLADAIDFNHLNLEDITLEVRDFQWLSELIKADIKDFNLIDHSGFRLNRLKGKVSLEPEQTALNNLLIRTSQSNIEADFVALHDSFGDWAQNLEEQVQMQIEIFPTSIAFQDLNYFAPSIQEIDQINTDLTRTIQLEGQIKGTLNQLEQIVIKGSIADDLVLSASGSAQNLTQPDQLRYQLRLQNLATSYDKLVNLTNNIAIPNGLDSLGQIQLKGNFNGSTNRIRGRNIRLLTNTYTQFSGNFQANHLSDKQPITFNLDIKEARTTASNLEGFVKNGLPPEIARLGKMQYSGKISGDVYDIRSEGELQSEVGTLVTDGSINFDKDYTDAHYRGQLALDRFDLGYLLQDTTIGKISLGLRGAGAGLHLDSLQAELEGVVSSFEFKGYEYHNLEIDGLVEQKQFSGSAYFADPNLNFNFRGNVNLNDSIPDLRFTANIDTINLPNLNFDQIPYAFSGKIISNFKGNNLDNIDGSIRLENVHLANDTVLAFTDSILLLAENLPNGKRLSLDAEFIHAIIEGNYKIRDLPATLAQLINDYFPTQPFLNTKGSNPSKDPLSEQVFTASIGLDEPLPFLNLFTSSISNLDTADFQLDLDTKAKKIALQGQIPSLGIQSNTLDQIDIQLASEADQLVGKIQAENVDYGLDSPLSLAQLTLALGNDSLEVHIQAEEAKTDSTYVKLALGGQVTPIDDTYRLVLDENFLLNNSIWKVDANNELFYQPDFIDINRLILQKGPQAISFRTQDQANTAGLAPLVFGFQNFELAEIFTLINQEDANYDGKINGQITLRDYTGKPNYLADLSIQEIYLEGQEVGNLALLAAQDGLAPIIDLEAALDGPTGQFSAQGTYQLPDQSLALDAEIQALEVKLIDPFLQGLIRDSEGDISGKLSVEGPVNAPIIAGDLALDSVSTILPISGLRYTMPAEKVRFEQGEMRFNQTQLMDQNGNKATLSGHLDLNNLNDVGLDLNFYTSKFQILNTSAQDLELYYGQLFVSANVNIDGTASNPVLNMRARTLPQSRLFVQPLSVEQAVATKQRDFIIFANPQDYVSGDSTATVNQAYRVSRNGVDLSLNLEVTPDAELQIIIDPTTGDKLVCRGTADMSIKMAPTGELNLQGNYQITNGSYALNYQGILKKDFEISSDSRLDFIGDPLDTRFDVSAIYTAVTPTFELIRNRITDENSIEAISAKRRQDVEVILSMRGDLDEPIINFDIQVPESGNITNVTRQELQRLRENPSELNKQVFSLLLLNSFLSQQSGGGILADAGTSVYLSSVSALLTNQLNRLADNYIKGVDVNIGIDSYQADLGTQGNTITEVNLGVSKGLFDDRLTVKVGGNVNLNSQNALLVEGANFSSIAGDFILEYKLNPAGNYRLRVFRRDNYDVLNQDNAPQTGVGITFGKSFGNVNEQKKDKKND